MARKQVVEVQCERCDRVEHQEVNKEKDLYEPLLEVRFNGTKTTFEDLCGPCRETVSSHLAAVMKKIEGLSPDRKKNEKKTDEAIERRVAIATLEKGKDKVQNNAAKKKEPEMVPSPMFIKP